MARSAADIQLEIDNIEAHLKAATSLIGTSSADGVSVTNAQRQSLEQRLDRLYFQLERATKGMLLAARVRGD